MADSINGIRLQFLQGPCLIKAVFSYSYHWKKASLQIRFNPVINI